MPKIILSETYTSFIDIMHLRYQFIHFFSDLVIFQLSHISFLMIVFVDLPTTDREQRILTQLWSQWMSKPMDNLSGSSESLNSSFSWRQVALRVELVG